MVEENKKSLREKKRLTDQEPEKSGSPEIFGSDIRSGDYQDSPTLLKTINLLKKFKKIYILKHA